MAARLPPRTLCAAGHWQPPQPLGPMQRSLDMPSVGYAHHRRCWQGTGPAAVVTCPFRLCACALSSLPFPLPHSYNEFIVHKLYKLQLILALCSRGERQRATAPRPARGSAEAAAPQEADSLGSCMASKPVGAVIAGGAQRLGSGWGPGTCMDARVRVLTQRASFAAPQSTFDDYIRQLGPLKKLRELHLQFLTVIDPKWPTAVGVAWVVARCIERTAHAQPTHGRWGHCVFRIAVAAGTNRSRWHHSRMQAQTCGPIPTATPT